MDHIRDNWELLRTRIERAAERSGRTASAIEVVAVSKTRSAGEIEAAYACGLRLVGENRIQEAAVKRPQVAAPSLGTSSATCRRIKPGEPSSFSTSCNRSIPPG